MPEFTFHPHTPIPTFEASRHLDATHYYHMREDSIHPIEKLSELHPGDCVLPLKRVPSPKVN